MDRLPLGVGEVVGALVENDLGQILTQNGGVPRAPGMDLRQVHHPHLGVVAQGATFAAAIGVADAAIYVLVQVPQHHHGFDQKDRAGAIAGQSQVAADPAQGAKLLLPLALLLAVELVHIKAAGVVNQRSDILGDVGAAAPQPHQADGRKIVRHCGAGFVIPRGGGEYSTAKLLKIVENAGQVPLCVVEIAVAGALLIIRAGGQQISMLCHETRSLFGGECI